MKLGFDIDDVVADTEKIVTDFIASQYGVEWLCGPTPYTDLKNNTFHCDTEINNQIVEKLSEAFDSGYITENVELIEGAREALQKFRRNGHSIHFITSRPKWLQPATFKWLRKYKVPFDSLDVITSTVEKGIYGRRYNLDMYVDDLEENLASMYAYKKRWRKGLILFDTPWNCGGHDGSKYIRIKGWKELLRHVGIQNR